jgi:hypothetical protein
LKARYEAIGKGQRQPPHLPGREQNKIGGYEDFSIIAHSPVGTDGFPRMETGTPLTITLHE